ncbi:MAG TPA: class I SAM-dependent methyltransferase [Methanocorpusculum sp.]|nr:class I SAM-dependent methyltransferase [Methanocorpusculum sp.]
MSDADSEWREITQKQRGVSSYKTSAEFFSIQKFVDKMMQNLKNGGMHRAADQLAVMNIPAGSTVLDIGAGPGTLAVPLAGSGCRVTVVEPSKPMTRAMDQYREFRNVEASIGVIQEAWEDVDPKSLEKYDYIISSFALSVPDLKDALEKMHHAANKEVHIFWFMNEPVWDVTYADLWEELHGEKYWSKPKADVVWNCLNQMGIYADISVHPMKDSRGYADLNSAVEEYADRMDAHEERQKKIIRKYLDEVLVKGESGNLVFPEEGLYAHISWKV